MLKDEQKFLAGFGCLLVFQIFAGLAAVFGFLYILYLAVEKFSK